MNFIFITHLAEANTLTVEMTSLKVDHKHAGLRIKSNLKNIICIRAL
jgi:hypothetical protein